mgnify:CR=1 FL=1
METQPSISQMLQFMQDINMYAKDDYEGKTVSVDALTEVMTNYYEYGCSVAIIDLIEEVDEK